MPKSNEKILFLTRSLDYGGAERQLVALAKGLHERGYAVCVACFYAGGPLEKDLRDAGIPAFDLGKRGRWDVLPFLWRLAGLIRREKPAVIHGYITVPNLLTVMFKPFFPRTKMVWGVRASEMDFSQCDLVTRVVFWLGCFFSRWADVIIVNSHAGLNEHVRHGYPARKMVVIPNGIDTGKFTSDRTKRSLLRAELGIEEHEILIGLVARIDPRKDHPAFIEAGSMLSKERDDIRLICVGDGPEPLKAKLSALSGELGLNGRLIWAGARRDMQAVYSALDILVSSSYTEGFPNVIGEAMACGVPCVVTDAGDSRIIVGETGIVVAPRKPGMLKTGLERILEKREASSSTLAGDCRRRIVENFSIQAMVGATLKALI